MHTMRHYLNILAETQLTESMNLMAVAKQKMVLNDKEVDVWSDVFPDEWSDPYLTDPDDPWGMSDKEPERNPHYRDDLTLNMSNENAHALFDALGLNAESLIPIDQFINLATHWLQQHLGKQSPEVSGSIDKRPGGPTMIDAGRREGYLNEKIVKAVKIAREGKAHGATHISIH